LSWDHACKLEQQLQAEFDELMHLAEKADTEYPDGMDIPKELHRRQDRMNGIAEKIESKATLTADETTFLTTNPLAALPILQTAVATNMQEATIAGLADITAKAYGLQILSDLYIPLPSRMSNPDTSN
jgi:hypothetical protein